MHENGVSVGVKLTSFSTFLNHVQLHEINSNISKFQSQIQFIPSMNSSTLSNHCINKILNVL